MNEKPILFNGEMVRAILEGRKTQTRRIVNDKHLPFVTNMLENFVNNQWDKRPFPYGKPGDRLWVRETWATAATFDHMKPSNIPKGQHIWCTVEDDSDFVVSAGHWRGKTRPSIFMPRWASRITLEIKSIRVERLQEISEEDAKAEGMELTPVGTATWSNRQSFQVLWDSINANRKDKQGNPLPYTWDDNPWVWVVEFEKVGS